MRLSSKPIHPRGALVRLLSAGLLCLVYTLAHASPDEGSDPVNRLLRERGLLANETIEQPRNPGHTPLKKAAQTASDMVITAMNFLGVRYQSGGNDSRNGFDCSGFTRHIYEQSLGVSLPRRVDDQASASGMMSVDRNDLKPGDLVFFNTLARTFSHVGIYIGEGKFIHAPRSGSYVRVENLRVDYWSRRFTGARRVQTARNELRPEPRLEPNHVSNYIPAYVPIDYAGDLYSR
jgi:cell wall-associated NlpC family hydrolase